MRVEVLANAFRFIEVFITSLPVSSPMSESSWGTYAMGLVRDLGFTLRPFINTSPTATVSLLEVSRAMKYALTSDGKYLNTS